MYNSFVFKLLPALETSLSESYTAHAAASTRMCELRTIAYLHKGNTHNEASGALWSREAFRLIPARVSRCDWSSSKANLET